MTKKSPFPRRDSSTSFDDSEESRVRKLAKHMLKSSLFIGSFIEKRFVEPLNSYRDVIKISDEETDLIENLKIVRKRCCNFYHKDVWVGITEPSTIGAPAGYNLWVTLDEEVFGSYWYKIKNVECYDNEVRVKLEVVRPVREKTPVLNISSQQVLDDLSQGDLKNLGIKFQSCGTAALSQISETLTWPNLKQTCIFLFLLVSTLLTFLIQTIQYLMDYVLKLMRETSGFIKVCTPIIIAFMRLIMNTINGLYTLIAILWRDRSSPKNNPIIYQMPPYQSPYYNYNNMRAIPYHDGDHARNRQSHRSSVKITPLD